jgi:teichuronic acid exporter
MFSKSTKSLFSEISGKLVFQIANLTFTIILSRILSPEDFGLMAMLLAISSIASVLSELGLHTAIIQRSAIAPEHLDTAFCLNLIAAIFLSIILFLSAPGIAAFFDISQDSGTLRLLCPLFLLNSLASIPTAVLTRNMRFGALSVARGGSSLIGGAVAIFLAKSGLGVNALIAQLMLSTSIFAISVLGFSRWRPSLRFTMAALNDLWPLGSKMLASGIIDTIYRRFDVFVIARTLPTIELGYYSRAKFLESTLSEYTGASVGRVLFPALSALQRSDTLFRELFISFYFPLMWIVFLLSTVSFSSSEQIVTLLLSSKWLETSTYFSLLLLGTYASPLSAPLGAILQARGEGSLYLRAEIIKKSVFGVCLASLAFFGIKLYLYSMAIGMLIAYFVNLHYACLCISMPRALIVKEWLTLLLCATGAAFSTYTVSSYVTVGSTFWQLLLNTTASLVFYLAFSFLGSSLGLRSLKGQLLIHIPAVLKRLRVL